MLSAVLPAYPYHLRCGISLSVHSCRALSFGNVAAHDSQDDPGMIWRRQILFNREGLCGGCTDGALAAASCLVD